MTKRWKVPCVVPQVGKWKLDNKQWPYQTRDRASNLIARHHSEYLKQMWPQPTPSCAQAPVMEGALSGPQWPSVHKLSFYWSHVIWFARCYVTPQNVSGFFSFSFLPQIKFTGPVKCAIDALEEARQWDDYHIIDYSHLHTVSSGSRVTGRWLTATRLTIWPLLVNGGWNTEVLTRESKNRATAQNVHQQWSSPVFNYCLCVSTVMHVYLWLFQSPGKRK